ncbi:MAG: hemolysin family protein [Lachnospiraceae bacterium]|nr:hemolysin family protein [Lachnospiraceae bacterium]
MDDGGPANIALFIILILIDVFFYGFGAAVMELNGKEVERRASEEKDKKSVRLLKILDNPTCYINTLQLVVSMVNIALGAIYIENTFKGAGTVLRGAALLYLLLCFGILVPKRVASRMPEKWAYAFVNPVWFIMLLLYPLTGLVSVTVRGILFLFGIRGNNDENDVTEEEIIDMVNEGHEQGLIQASEAEMISNIFEFGDKEAKDIMTHRNNIVAIDAATSLEDAINFMLEGKNSRYPVYEENIDHIVGILHLKDAARFRMEEGMLNTQLGSIAELLMEPLFVPQTKNIDELFREMQKNKLQMVIIVDEYGQTAGLIAMEDILEEIVGNIQDEYDEDGEHIEEKGKDEYIIEGKTPLEELEERLSISFDNEDFDTLNGYLISKLDRIPEEYEEFDVDCDGYNFKILEVSGKVITKVLVTRLPENTGAGEAADLQEDAVTDDSALEEIKE